jgi:hypothetical protein
MIIYKDRFTGDELFSDSFPHKLIENDAILEIKAKWVVLKEGEVNIGANPSTEEGAEDEGVEDVARKVVDVVEAFKLQETGFDKKGFLAYAKTYMKKVRAALEESGKSPEYIKNFESGAQNFIKRVINSFNDWQFFAGEQIDLEAGLVYAIYDEGASDPTMYIIRDGCEEMKV